MITLKNNIMSSPKQKAEDLVHQNRMLLMEYGDEYGEEILVSVLAIKLALNTVDRIIEAIDWHILEYPNKQVDFWLYVRLVIDKL